MFYDKILFNRKKERDRINNSLNTLFEKMFNLVKGRAKILPILEVLGGMAVAIVIYVASFRVMSGDLTPGSVIGFVTALLMLAQPTKLLELLIQSLKKD